MSLIALFNNKYG